jgi:hypothetical protein
LKKGRHLLVLAAGGVFPAHLLLRDTEPADTREGSRFHNIMQPLEDL